MRILVIEDDAKTASFIVKGLEEAGYSVVHVADGRDGLFEGLNESFDAAVIDIMLPRLDGLQIIETLRLEKVNTPILILSAKKTLDDRIKGLQIGGDDYLVKPFAFTELLVRLQALIRRSTNITEATTLSVADLEMDLISRKVQRAGKKIELQPREFSLLEYLMRNTGRVVSKTMLIEHVWEYNFDPQTNVVESRMVRLRGKIDRSFDKKLIHTIRGVGYVLEESG